MDSSLGSQTRYSLGKASRSCHSVLRERHTHTDTSLRPQIIEFPVVLLQWRKKNGSRPLGTAQATDSDSDSVASSSSDSEEEGEESGSSDSTAGENGNTPGDEETQEHDSDVGATWELVPVDEFRRFVRPTWRPALSQFCIELTGITQEEVDGADTFTGVLEEFCWTFVEKHELFRPGNKTVWVTDGPWVGH